MFDNLGATFDGTTHGNVFYWDNLDGGNSNPPSLTGYFYNNWIMRTQAPAAAAGIYPNPGTSGASTTATYYVYNNVTDCTIAVCQAQQGDNADPYLVSGNPTGIVHDWNNTYQMRANDGACVNVTSRMPVLNTIDVVNVHCIGESVVSLSFDSATNHNNTTPITQSIETANGQGYVSPRWGPANGSTVAAGTNLASNCSGELTALCSDSTVGGTRVSTIMRPSVGAWDIGAYQFIGASRGRGLRF